MLFVAVQLQAFGQLWFLGSEKARSVSFSRPWSWPLWAVAGLHPALMVKHLAGPHRSGKEKLKELWRHGNKGKSLYGGMNTINMTTGMRWEIRRIRMTGVCGWTGKRSTCILKCLEGEGADKDRLKYLQALRWRWPAFLQRERHPYRSTPCPAATCYHKSTRFTNPPEHLQETTILEKGYSSSNPFFSASLSLTKSHAGNW